MALSFYGRLCFVFLFAPAFVHGQDFDALLTKVPESANALVLIDVEQTLASELAQQEGWARSWNWPM